MQYALSISNADIESTERILNLNGLDIVSEFKKTFPLIEHIDFYSTVGLGTDSYIDPKTAEFLNQLQDQNSFSFCFTSSHLNFAHHDKGNTSENSFKDITKNVTCYEELLSKILNIKPVRKLHS